MVSREDVVKAYEKLQDPNVVASEVYDSLVAAATSDLDSVMQEIYSKIVTSSNYSIEDVQVLFTKLGNYVYFFGQRVEKMGLESDVADHSMKEAYNNAYNDSLIGLDGKKRTANELNTIAEAASLSESVLNDIYKRAYKAIKFKVDSAQSMVGTLSKIYSKKMQEMNFASQFDNSKVLLG